MSRKFRVGNDIPINWSLVNEDGSPYIVEGKNFAIELLIGNAKRVRIGGATANENTISFEYLGKDQGPLGSVNLIYIENNGKIDMVTFDTEDAFTMVPHSWLAVDEDETPETITFDVVTVVSGGIVIGATYTVKYTPQSLTDAQKEQARTNIGAGTYSKPSGGIPSSDLADGVIPDVSQFITKSVNDLVNYYLKSETYTKAEVQALIGAIQQFHYEIVATLPATGEGNVLYLLGPTGTGADKYEEYVYANSTWTKIGDTSISLAGYVTTQELNTALANYWPKADVVNITLSDLAVSGDWDDIENNPIPEPSASDNGKVLGVTNAQGTLGWVQSGGVTSVGLSVPTCLQVTGSPITSSGTLAVTFKTGYSIPTDAKQSGWDAKYDKPSGGIPKTDLASAVQTSLGKADSALQSFTETDPVFTASTAAGITASDITAWNGKYTKPASGIPASDIAAGVIPSVESLTTAEIDTIWNNAA